MQLKICKIEIYIPFPPSKYFVGLQLIFKACLEDVFSVKIFRLQRRFQDVLQRVLQELLKTSLRHFQDVLKTSWKKKKCYAEDVLKPSLDILETNKCLLGEISNAIAGMRSVLLYGCERWALISTDLSQITRTDNVKIR